MAQQCAGGLDLLAGELIIVGLEVGNDLPEFVHGDPLIEGFGDMGGEAAGPDVAADAGRPVGRAQGVTFRPDP
ncbi:hypothetical protein [Streptomyces sp. NBC_01233]|uniref:hypothetical protein n=1 Tax=Streptomyces sp. NBC_01233 TaxID=2903787 RepID=UPI002E1132DC|nr:hypothetical protein OG332_28290 [Streptomyces sp. NBC_01233]